MGGQEGDVWMWVRGRPGGVMYVGVGGDVSCISMNKRGNSETETSSRTGGLRL